MQVVIDYLTLTSKVHDIQYFKESLGLTECSFMIGRPYNGWFVCEYFDGVKLLYGGRDDVCVDMSGKGCRTVEHVSEMSFNWFGFFRSLETELKSKEVHISRLDVAGDDFDKVLSYSNMVRYTKEYRYICKAKKRVWMDGDEQVIYFGSRTSDRRLRIYNKAMEQGYDEDAHWIRVEFQLRNESALSFVLNWYQVEHIGKCYQGVLVDYLRYINEPVTHEHHSRATVTRWWRKFTGDAAKISQVYLQGREYNIASVEDFVRRQATSSLKTLLAANGGDLSQIVDMIEKAKFNRKQEMLLANLQVS